MTKYVFIFFLIFYTIDSANTYSQERLIKAGDVLEISVTENEALSQAVIVKPDGTIEFPALQGVPIDGITLERFQEILIAQLSRYLPSTPLVFVKFGESYPIRVTVLGQVTLPGLYRISNTSTLQGAIAAAGSFTPGAQLTRIRLIRNATADKQEQVINLEQFYLKGDPNLLPILEDGDIIVVPGNPLATNVKILGSVENPGSYDVFFQTTILDVIFMAGGPTDDANLKDIKIISQTGQPPRKIRLDIKDFFKPNSNPNFPVVFPGDVIYVSKKKINWQKIINIIRDLTAFASLYYIISMSMRE